MPWSAPPPAPQCPACKETSFTFVTLVKKSMHLISSSKVNKVLEIGFCTRGVHGSR